MLTIKSAKPDLRKVFFGVLFIFLSFVASSVSGQNLCFQNLKKAQKEYDEGRLSEVPTTLEECLKGGFTRDQQLQGYRLLILTYLFTDEPELAEQYLLKLLKEDPEYSIDPAVDPAEFVALFNSYRTLPTISIGLAGGVNRTGVKETESRSTDDVNASKAKYKAGFGYQFGFISDIYLSKKLQLNAGLFFSGKKYVLTRDVMFNYSTLTLSESQSWVELPVSLKYHFRKIGQKKFIPFAFAGVSGNLLLSSRSNVTRKSSEGKDIDASGPSVKMTDLRNKLNYSALLGVGARYKIGYGYIFLDVRYNLGMRNVVNEKNRNSNDVLTFYYGHIDSDFTLRNMSVSVCYLKSFYKPKKIIVKK
jgi:hypothetical protein